MNETVDLKLKSLSDALADKDKVISSAQSENGKLAEKLKDAEDKIIELSEQISNKAESEAV